MKEIASSSSTWLRKWPTASPAIGLIRLLPFSIITPYRTGRAYPLRGLFSCRPPRFQKNFLPLDVPNRPPGSVPGPLAGLFPLNGTWGFGADIVNHPSHPGHFIDDARGHAF